jgi:CheY-like chemotaxis protein
MRVLVVEDAPDVGAVLHDLLLELGHQPAVVRSAAAALTRLEVERPDAVLVELRLPGLSGLDFLRLRPVRDSAVPVVAISGSATEGEAREALRLGAIDFVNKPVHLQRMREVLACLEPYALGRQLGHSGPERRRLRRVPADFPVRVRTADGSEWESAARDLSPRSIGIVGGVAKPTGTAAVLALALPDGLPPLRVPSVLVRAGVDSAAFSFVSVGTEESQRLAEFTRPPR